MKLNLQLTCDGKVVREVPVRIDLPDDADLTPYDNLVHAVLGIGSTAGLPVLAGAYSVSLSAEHDGRRGKRHECPGCTCGLLALEWRRRRLHVHPEDVEALAAAIVDCALDHPHLRPETGVPWGLPPALRTAALPIVEKHLSAANKLWWRDGVYLCDARREALRADLVAALRAAGGRAAP